MTDRNERRRDVTVADGGTKPATAASDDASDIETMQGNGGIPEAEPTENREFLLEVVRRAPLLRVLRAAPADASELAAQVDMSRSTVHRATDSLEKLDIIDRADGAYELTGFGEVIAEQMASFGRRTSTALSLKQFLNSIDMDGNGITVEEFSDAKITRRKARQPHATIHRITELIRNSDRLRMFSTVISPVYVDVAYKEMMNGMEITALFDREVVEIMLSEYPEKAYESIETGNFEVYAHDGLPFEMFLFDDKIGVAAHNENGNAEVLIECDEPSAREWAETLYADQLADAEPLATSDLS